MFDIGWTEMIVVACVAIIVVGPKDLPKMLRAFGKTMGNLRRMAGDFQRQFDDALRETELDELKNIGSPSSFKPLDDVQKSTAKFKEQMEAAVAENKSVIAEKKAAEAAKTEPAKGAAKPKTATSKSASKQKTAGRASSRTSSSTPAAKAKAASQTKSASASKSAGGKTAPAASKPKARKSTARKPTVKTAAKKGVS